MADYASVLNDARQLSAAEQLPEDAELPLHEAWVPELERRVAAIEAGTAQTVPWETIRTEALARIHHGKRT
jgi:putative addiction module component (TIGR02574 family)